MKLGFNEANDRFCANHSVMMDLELCEKYGFDCIDIQSECLNRDLEAGKITLEEMGAWFQSHHLKMLSYNALCFFNMKQTQEEKDAVMAELDEIIRRCNILGCKMIVVVPSKDMKERGLTPTRKEIREDAVAVLKEMVKKCEPHGIRLSLEFCGEPSMTINRFEDAYAIVEEVNSPLVGVTLDQYHFYAMGSGWDTLEKADGKKIFVWHLNGTEDMPCGAYYNNDEKTKEVLSEDGWLYTGDMAKADEDGFIYLVDRKKDVIITGGENIYPVQIEDFLRQHNAIKDVAVIGLPDARLGEITAAIVEVKPEATLTEEELQTFCMALPRYKRPRKIIFADVPRNPTGKIEKPKLRKRYCVENLVAKESGVTEHETP